MTAKISELSPQNSPAYRVKKEPTQATTVDLVAVILGGDNQLEKAQSILEVAENRLSYLLKASRSQLKGVTGVGDSSVLRLKASLALAVRLTEEQPDQPRIITCPENVTKFVGDMRYLEQEEFRVICLNTRNHIQRIVTLYRGSVNSALIRVGEVFRPAIRENSPAIIVVHNHPSGDPSPSPDDVAITKTILKAGKLLDIQVLDHIIVGGHKITSLNRRGLGFDNGVLLGQ